MGERRLTQAVILRWDFLAANGQRAKVQGKGWSQPGVSDFVVPGEAEVLFML